MSTQQYTANPAAAVALVAATAKTVLSVRAATTSRSVSIVTMSIGFDGITGNAIPVLVELCRISYAGAGAGSTAITPQQVKGPAGASASSSASGFTTEPTALVVMETYLITPAGGQWTIQYPDDQRPESETGLAQAAGVCIRVNAPAVVNCRPYFKFEE